MVSDTLARVRALVAEGKVRVSDHGYDELVDDILVIDVLDGIQSAILVEDYPEFGKGPSVLVLQQDAAAGRPIHVVWGIPKGRAEPAVVVTAYRPDLSRWSGDFMKRKT